MEVIEIRIGQLATTETKLRSRQAEHDADDAAHRAERDRFDQELGEDVAAMRADGHADADFARPLGHAHEHDVHDADAADDERNARDRAEQRGHDPEVAVAVSAISSWVRTVKSSSLPAADVVALPEQLDDLLLRGGELLRAGDLHVDVAQGRAAGEDPFHRAACTA